MTTPKWQVSGQYYETCSCDFVCPCVPWGWPSSRPRDPARSRWRFRLIAGPTGPCPLDGLGFIVLGFTPEEMGNGNWSVGLIADERASAEQRDAITAIVSGAAGGPMAALSGLIGKFLGVQSAPIRFDRSGPKWSVKASGFVDMAAEGVKGINPDATEPMHLDNTGHPAADRFALAHASKSRVQRARAWHGKTTAAGTTDSTRRSPGAARSAARQRRWPPGSRRASAHRSRIRAASARTRVVLLVLVPAVSWLWIIVDGARHVRADDRRQRLDDDPDWDLPHCCCCGRCGR